MQAFLMNLDRDTERLARMNRLGKECGVDWTRVSAIDRSDPLVVGRAQGVSATIDGSIPGPGSIACLESHRKIWRRTVAGDARYAAIFEDDILFAASLPDIIRSESWIPDDCDILRLETWLKKVRLVQAQEMTFPGRRVARMLSTHLGSAAYIISKAAALRLLEFTDEHTHTVDLLMFHDQSPLFSELAIYQMLPAPCIQANFLGLDKENKFLRSSLEPEREALRSFRVKPRKEGQQPGFIQKALRELRRANEKYFPIGPTRIARVEFSAK